MIFFLQTQYPAEYNLVIAAVRVDILARASLLQLQLRVVHRINLYLPELQVQASAS